MSGRKKPNPTDRYVGARVRMRRLMLGMSQTALGNSLGVTFQQVQKYEKGANRIGASRLQQIGAALQVPVSFFFEELPVPAKAQASTEARVHRRAVAEPDIGGAGHVRRDWRWSKALRGSRTPSCGGGWSTWSSGWVIPKTAASLPARSLDRDRRSHAPICE